MPQADQPVAITRTVATNWFSRLRVRPSSPAVPPITQPQLEELLTRARADIGGKVFAHIWTMLDKMADAETARLARIEDKAKSLLTAAGASLSFTLTFGVKTLIDNRPALAHAPKWLYVLLHGFAVLSVLASLVANLWAVRAVTVGPSYRAFNLHDVLNENSFSWIGKAEDGDARLARYQEYLLPQAALIVQERFAANEEKASLVKAGQRAFLVFLGLLLGASLMLAVLALRAPG